MILDGLKRIVGSAKVQLLASAAFGAVATYLMTPGTAAEKRGLMETMVYALAALVGAVILGWAHEDAATKSGPSQQVNVQSDVKNPPPAAIVPPPAPAPVPDPQQQLVEDVYTQVLHRLEARAAAQNKARAAALAAQQAAVAIPEPPKGE